MQAQALNLHWPNVATSAVDTGLIRIFLMQTCYSAPISASNVWNNWRGSYWPKSKLIMVVALTRVNHPELITPS